jgi:ArsR family transcriptional regulator
MSGRIAVARTSIAVLEGTTPTACCAPLASTDLTDGEATATAKLFKALGDPNRVRIVNRLATSAAPVCVCDINRDLDVSQPTVSFHLKKLVEAGILSRERRGVWAYYSIDNSAAKRLRGVLEFEREEAR